MNQLAEHNKHFNELLVENGGPFYIFSRKYREEYNIVKKKLTRYPHLKFGQVICNEICKDYKTKTPSKKTMEIMSTLFYNSDERYACQCDPKDEDPEETWNRHCRLRDDAMKSRLEDYDETQPEPRGVV